MNVVMTEAEFARWQGHTDQRVEEHERRLSSINGSIDDLREEVYGIRTELARQGARVGMLAAVAAGAGSTLSGLILYFLTRGSA